ncbi:Hypothetical predicted protein [Lecanosticta acicola]|uniref:Uncharacterized protein n=1 Tax=Lecanosticta acicola TaxID=111012 RepID=A0AAI9EFR1_9PEZI|nr:Hypothetical predicted protein [Lecanosticta acicola]
MHLRDVASGALLASSAMGAALTTTTVVSPAIVATTATAGGTHDSSAVLQFMIENGDLNFREGPLGPFRHRGGQVEDPHDESHVPRSCHACRKLVHTSDGVDPCEQICHRSNSTSSTMPPKPFAGIHPPDFDDTQSSVTHPITRRGVNGTEGCLVVAITDAGLFQAMAAASTVAAVEERNIDDSLPIRVTTTFTRLKRGAQEKTVTGKPALQPLDMTWPADQMDYTTYWGRLISTSTFSKKRKKTHSETKTSTTAVAAPTPIIVDMPAQ